MLSHFDPRRETVGKIYRDLQLKPVNTAIECGDMGREMTKGLVEDVNEALMQKALSGDKKPFYLIVHEKKDLQMNQAIARNIKFLSYRPWPEGNTVVWYKNPKTDEIKFCWCLPHWSELEHVLDHPEQYTPEYVADCRALKNDDMKHFGFVYHPKLRWIPDPKFIDRDMNKYKAKVLSI